MWLSFNFLLRSSWPYHLHGGACYDAYPSIFFWDLLLNMPRFWTLKNCRYLQFSSEIFGDIWERLIRGWEDWAFNSLLRSSFNTKWFVVSVPDNDPSILFWDLPTILECCLQEALHLPSILFWDLHAVKSVLPGVTTFGNLQFSFEIFLMLRQFERKPLSSYPSILFWDLHYIIIVTQSGTIQLSPSILLWDPQSPNPLIPPPMHPLFLQFSFEILGGWGRWLTQSPPWLPCLQFSFEIFLWRGLGVNQASSRPSILLWDLHPPTKGKPKDHHQQSFNSPLRSSWVRGEACRGADNSNPSILLWDLRWKRE